MNRNNKYLTLARRELWEHRGLWLVPLIAAGLLVCAATFGTLNFNGNGMHVSLDSPMPQKAGEHIGSISMLGVATAIGLFAGIVMTMYLLDCLFNERKDRSILFWKSLPVSDAETVLTKLVVAMVLVPLLVLVLAVLLQPLLAGIVGMRFPETRPYIGQLLGGSLAAVPRLAGIGVFALLWYAPVATYMMLASVLAKRTPIVYAIMPPIALIVAERLLFRTAYVGHFVGERLLPWPDRGDDLYFVSAKDGMASLGGGWWKLFSDPAMWLGLVAAAAMIYVVVRLRRYRDDT